MSAKGQQTAFLKAIQAMSEKTGQVQWSLAELRALAHQMPLKLKYSIDDLVDRLNHQGLLLKKGNGLYSVMQLRH